jgi:hypothetical protein
MRVRLSFYGAQWFSVLRLVLNEATLYLTEKQIGLIAKVRRPTFQKRGASVCSEMKNQHKDGAGQRNRCP